MAQQYLIGGPDRGVRGRRYFSTQAASVPQLPDTAADATADASPPHSPTSDS
jgi:hypothetical protein